MLHVEIFNSSFMETRVVATGVYRYLYPPNQPKQTLWGKNDVRTAIRQFYTPPPPKKKINSGYATDGNRFNCEGSAVNASTSRVPRPGLCLCTQLGPRLHSSVLPSVPPPSIQTSDCKHFFPRNALSAKARSWDRMSSVCL